MLQMHFLGDTQNCTALLAALLPELAVENTPDAAYKVQLLQGKGVQLQVLEGQARITYGSLAMLGRTLAYLRAHYNQPGFAVNEQPIFNTNGIMLDCSRNCVPTVDAAKAFLRKLALMGLNFAMLYTEDTYVIEGEPYFGYMRGAFTADEIRALDDYAYGLGIELIPCIQTLGHYTHVLKWPAYNDVRNTLDIMLIDEEKTYAFIEKSIVAATAPYRSKRIHIGLDEADDLAEGVYRKLHGLKDGTELMQRHVERVLGIVHKLGLQPMMWSDMYFRPTFGKYYEFEREMPEAVAQGVPRGVQQVFWDYYHETQAEYDHMFHLHEKLGSDTIFAGGIYTWLGAAPDYQKTINSMVPALYSAKANGVKEVFATIWSNDGAECPYVASLYGCQLFAEFGYTGAYDPQQLKTRFAECCGADADMFLELTRLDYLPGDLVGQEVSTPGSPKRSKNLLFEDPLMPLFEKDFAGMDLVGHYADFEKKFADYAKQNPQYALLFDFYAKYARVVAGKCLWRSKAANAVRSNDRAAAAALAKMALDMKKDTEVFIDAWRELWHAYNKPFGFELLDIRMGGVLSRLSTAAQRMQAFADGRLLDIEELSCQKLPFSRNMEGVPFGTVRKQKWHDFATVNTMGGYTNLRS